VSELERASGVTRHTIYRIIREEQAKDDAAGVVTPDPDLHIPGVPAFGAPPPAAPSPLALTEEDLADPERVILKVIRDTEAAINRAKDSHDAKAESVQRNTLAGLVSDLARVRMAKEKSGNAIVRTEAELKAARKRVREKLSALEARGGIRCADCNKQLSIEWGEEVYKS
jgi:hypothetical protein